MSAEPPVDREALDARLHAAAANGDAASLTKGYRQAAAMAEAAGAADAAAFFRTHAYVWALVAGDGQAAEALAQALRREGRLDHAPGWTGAAAQPVGGGTVDGKATSS